MSRITCDADGWILQVNQEPAYETHLHRLPVSDLLSVQVEGDAIVSYVGFGTDGKVGQRRKRVSLLIF